MDADTLVTGLIVAAAGGLSILAYRRPTVFNELWRRVRVWLLLALLATILWDWATIVTYLVLKPYLSESAAEAARDAAQGVRILHLDARLRPDRLHGVYGIAEVAHQAAGREREQGQILRSSDTGAGILHRALAQVFRAAVNKARELGWIV